MWYAKTRLQHVDRNSYYGAQQNPDAYGKTKDLTYVGGATYTGQLRKLLVAPATLTAGLEYQLNSLHDIMVGYGRDLKQDVRIASAFAQSEWKMGQCTVLAGLRLDDHNLIDNPILSPRVNFMWKPSRTIQTRLTWSTGFRAPQAYDEDLHVTAVGGEGVLIKLADGLSPERSNSFSGSADWTFSAGHFQFNFLAEAFYTSLDDVFYLHDLGTDTQGNSIQERRNGSGAEVYGVNIDAKAAHGSTFSVQAGLTMQRSRYKHPTQWSDNPEVDAIRDMPRTPDVYGYVTLTAQPLKRLDISLSGIYTGRMHVPHYAPSDVIPEDYQYSYIEMDEMVHTPQFFELGAKVAYTFVLNDHVKVQLNGGVQNLFDAFQKDLDRGTYRDSGYFYGPTQPRTFFVGAKVSI